MEDTSPADTLKTIVPLALQSLLSERFVASCELIAEYTYRLATQVFYELRLDRFCGAEFQDVENLLSAAALKPDAGGPLGWLLEWLALHDDLERHTDASGVVRFRTLPRCARRDPSALLAQQASIDERCIPAYTIAALAAERYPSVLRGEMSGEAALFGPDTFDVWSAYFSNDNPLYAVANTIGAILVHERVQDGSHTVLEMGGGLGSGAEAVWRRLQESGCAHTISSYRFTEISGMFLRRAQKRLRAAFPDAPFSFAKLDIDQPFAVGGVESGSCTLIYGANVLHVARDLAATLHQIREALSPGGTLVISECVRPFADRPIYVEFVFNLLDSFRAPVLVPAWRPNGGFLAPEQWRAALEANGFKDVMFLPDVARIRDRIPAFVIAGITAQRA